MPSETTQCDCTQVLFEQTHLQHFERNRNYYATKKEKSFDIEILSEGCKKPKSSESL